VPASHVHWPDTCRVMPEGQEVHEEELEPEQVLQVGLQSEGGQVPVAETGEPSLQRQVLAGVRKAEEMQVIHWLGDGPEQLAHDGSQEAAEH
jgi:hypothetical protein